MRAIKSLRQCAPEVIEAQKQIAPVLIAWVGVYVLFLLFWGPLIYFRAFYTPALALGFGLVLSNYHRATGNKPAGASAIAVIALALFNLGFYIGPNMRADSNAVMAAARNTNRVWDERTVIYFAGRKEADTAFEYFNDKARWKKFSQATRFNLEREIERAYKEGGRVWLNEGAAALMAPDWLAEYSRGEVIEAKTANGVARYVQLLQCH